MAEYIASLNMSVFVLDYDHNAPNPEHLKNTHEGFYRIIREKQPDLPVIFVTRPNIMNYGKDGLRNRETIFETYKNAIARNENVSYIDGYHLFDPDYYDCSTVDGCHPNDFGFVYMAKVIGAAIDEALRK